MRHHVISSFVPEAAYWCFNWPTRGPVEREQVLEGMPDLSLFKVLSLPCRHPASLHWQGHARWVVLAIDPADFAEQDGFVDFRRGAVLFNGPPREAWVFLREQGLPVPSSLPVQVAGDWERAAVGEYGVAVAGWDAVAQAGDGGVAFANTGRPVAGSRGIAVSAFAAVRAGDRGFAVTVHGTEATAGDGGLARAGEFGTARAGRGGVALGGTGGTATVCEHGLALARGSGRAIAGGGGVAFAWDDAWEGKVQAGEGGILLARWHDGSRDRIAVAYVGEGGIRPDTPYRVDEEGRFVECEPEQ